MHDLLGFSTAQTELYLQALTHSSMSTALHNERLEFLGDAVMGLIVTQWLYAQDETADEGVLSRKKSQLCCEQSMAQYAQQIGLKRWMRVKQAELRDQLSVQADAFEAFCGALFLDKKYDFTESWVLKRCEKLFKTILSAEKLKDPKTSLQELSQKNHWELPQYHLLKTEGPANAMTFFVQVELRGHCAEAQATTKKQAQQIAAEKLLNLILKGTIKI